MFDEQSIRDQEAKKGMLLGGEGKAAGGLAAIMYIARPPCPTVRTYAVGHKPSLTTP